jgi:hypothetical protein
MHKGKSVKLIVIFLGVIFTSLLPINSTKTLASAEESCVEDSGYFYIVDEYVNNRPAASPYYSKGECHKAALKKYGCIPSIEGKQFMARGVSYGVVTGIDYIRDEITNEYRNRCILTSDRDPVSCETQHFRFFTCSCREATSSWYSSLGISNSWTNLEGKKYECGLEEFVLSNLQALGVAKAFNPLGLLEQVTKLIFAIGIFLFIINFMQGALLYVRSSGEEAELKKARHKVTVSIVGFIFMFLITGVIIFTYGIIQSS